MLIGFRATLGMLVLGVGLAAHCRQAHAQEESPSTVGPLVLIVPTRGNASWLAAERRLDAELRALQLRVTYDAVVQQFDATLPERAQVARALVAIQVLREADLGILRFWFTQQPGYGSGYQHLEINLRNADVVSRAVLPVVEAIFDRVEASSGAPAARVAIAARVNGGSEQPALAEDSDCERTKGRRCAPSVAARLLVGSHLVTPTGGTWFAIGAGLRWRVWQALTLEGDADFQIKTRKTTAAVHVLYEFRNRLGRGVAIGPGFGLLVGEFENVQTVAPRASLRTEMFLPMSDSVDLAVAATVAQAWGLPQGVQHGGFTANAMLGLDWNFN